MSTLTYLTSLVQQAISRLNNYEANAKKVDELPHQTTLEPTSKLPVSRGGISEHVTVQQIISSIQNSNYNQLLAVGTITVDGTDIIIPSGVSGQINGLLYGTSTDTTIPIVLCEAGFNRKDILVLTTSNTVVVISGEETDGAIVLAPTTPIDTVYITEFDVNDSSIGTPIDPILGTQFKKKSESLGYGDPSLTGSEAVIQLRPEGNSRYAFSHAGLVSIDGFGLDLISGNPDAEAPYPGKDLFIENTGTTPFSLLHQGAGAADSKFFFLDETDLVVPAGGKVWLKYGATDCEVIFKSWSEVSTKRVAVCDLGRFRIQVTAVNNYVQHASSGVYYNPSEATGVSDHALLSPNNKSVVYKVPFDCSLEEIVLSMSTLNDGSFSIWKTAPNSNTSTPIELYHVDDSTPTLFKQFVVNSDLILKDSYIHIFYARRAYTSAWFSAGFLRFKEL